MTDTVALSKLPSLVLRHDPSAAGIDLDPGGWVAPDDLVRGLASVGASADIASIERVVAESDKRRFMIEDGRIRANQGHSLPVDLGLVPRTPPDVLYHGTAERFLDAILERGLLPMERRHVHLSESRETAAEVGRRHGRPVVLRVDAAGLCAAGVAFYLSANGVWLVDGVPANLLSGDDT